MGKKKLYVVTMYKWGDRSSHSYLNGVYTKKQKAIDACKAEEDNRGGKYNGEILEVDLDSTWQSGEPYKTIKKLRRNTFTA
jgi:hypothetical protein